MEESCEVQSEGNHAVPEKNKKRTVKTQMQIEALEKLYNEHKYPTESMKSQLAESLRLTEKQVSGWFCHRRLKDKRLGEACASGRQDRSSGVIQDRGSGLVQDSCGSTKQGDFVPFDPREVESRRLTAPEFSAADLNYELGSHYTKNQSGMDDTSSESSSPIRDTFLPENEVSFDPEIPRHLTQNENIVPINAKVMRARNGPSGYLKVKGKVENAAITAVKRQLGSHYREDGPPLAVEFEPLPPGAFESLVSGPVNKSYCVGGPILQNSPDIPRIHKQSNCGTCPQRYEVYNPKLNSHDLGLQGSDCHENYLSHQLRQKSLLPNYGNSVSRQKSSKEMNEDSAGEASAHDSEDNYEMRAKQSVEGMRMDSASSNLHPYSVKVSGEHNKFSLHDYNMSPKVTQREYLETSPSNRKLKRSGILDTEDGGQSRLMAKTDVEEVKYYGERRDINKHRDPFNVKIYSTNEKKVGKRSRGEFLHQQCLAKPSMAEMPSWKNRIKRSVVEMPSSFSEDETVETDSSFE